jgi:hypothetical protein
MTNALGQHSFFLTDSEADAIHNGDEKSVGIDHLHIFESASVCARKYHRHGDAKQPRIFSDFV